MYIELRRKTKTDKYTLGEMYIDGVYFCDTLEDRDRGLTSQMTVEEILKIKVFGETAIPMGIYSVVVTYSERFKQLMPLLLNVKGYLGIRMHNGSVPEHTHGCILVGKISGTSLINSRSTYKRLVKIISTAAKTQKISIFVHDN